MSENDKEATQDFLVRDILISNCGRTLTPELIDDMLRTFNVEMREGPAAWAFTKEDGR